MILAEDIITVHQFFIKEYGGIDGISELGSLESAMARPFQTFGGEDLYQPICEKAAAGRNPYNESSFYSRQQTY